MAGIGDIDSSEWENGEYIGRYWVGGNSKKTFEDCATFDLKYIPLIPVKIAGLQIGSIPKILKSPINHTKLTF